MAVKRQLRPSTARAAEVRPLVMRCGAFGDMVLLTVLLQQLALRFGKPVDVISSGPWTQPLLESDSTVGRLFIIRSRRTPYWLSLQQQRLVAWLRERGSGPTWFCDRGEGRGLLSLAGIPDDYICDTNAYTWARTDTFADRYLRFGSYTPKAFEGLLPPAKPGVPAAARLNIAPAALRELKEEIGTAKAERLHETDWLRYELPSDLVGHVWHGKYRGQEQKWFAARFTGADADIDLTADKHPEFRAWRWATLSELPDLIVPFKRELYVSVVTAFAGFAGV